MLKKLPIFLVFLLSLFLILNLSRSIWNLKQSEESLKNTKFEYEKAVGLNKKLKDELEYKKKDEFAEKEAREKLGYVKEGEVAVVIAQEQRSDSALEKRKEFEKLANPYKWFKVFFEN